MQHIIKKQVIELRLGRKQDAFRMQHLISAHYYNEIMPMLESVFNEYSGEDEVLVLENLEIDFGTIFEKDLEKNRFDETLLSKLKIKLQESLASLSKDKTFFRESRPMNDCRQWIYYMKHGYLNWNTLAINEQWYNHVLEILATDYDGISLLRKLILNEANIAYRIAMQHDDSFLQKLVEILTAKSQKQLIAAIEEIYLVTSRLQTSASQPMQTAGTFKKALWQQIITAAATSAIDLSTESIVSILLEPYAAQLPVADEKRKELLSSVTILKDVLKKIFLATGSDTQNRGAAPDDESRKAVKEEDTNTESITDESQPGKNSEESPRVNEELQKLLMDNKTDSKQIEYTDNHLEGQKIDKRGADEKDISINKKDKAGNEDERNYENKASEKNISDNGIKISKEDEESIRKSKEDNKNQIIKEDKVSKETIISNVSKTIEKEQQEEDSSLAIDKFDTSKENEENRRLSTMIPAEGIFIVHAGIVLVHPFIGSLFRRLHLVENNLFIDPLAKFRGIFLLHYLATGRTVAAESDLVLCKFLCAYPLSEPVPAEIIFTADELEEATDMLTALIQQWSKLGSTSIAGLREGFLQRTGKLFVKNDSPYVQVESSSIDVLLDYLPWNLSMIKLPWMKEILRVDWR